MRVVAEEPWNWFLFEDEGKHYLDVLVEHGAVSFSVTAELSADQVNAYERGGMSILEPVSGEMRHKALMREWRIQTLPADWSQRSVAAVQAWQRRPNG